MSRYLAQLTREARSKLKPPSQFGWAPRAAAFEEVYAERLVSDAPAPAPPRRGEQVPPLTAAPLAASHTPVPPAVPPAAAPMLPVKATPQTTEPSPRSREETTPEAAPPERQTRFPQLPPQPADPPLELHTVEFVEEDGLTPVPPRAPWTPPQPSPPRSTPRAAGEAARLTHPAPPPVVDVTIGKIEVTIEGERQPPPLRITRPPEPRGAPKRFDTPRRAGRLARLYLDR